MAVSKRFKYTDENGASVSVDLGAKAENVDVNGTPLTEILSEGLMSAEDKTNLDGMTVYSTTPQRVGTWIDGTPVWRVAFNNPISDSEKADNVIALPAFITDQNNMFVLDAKIYLYSGVPCLVDDMPIDYGSYLYSVEDNRISSGSWDGYYGWYEFVTPESNIR